MFYKLVAYIFVSYLSDLSKWNNDISFNVNVSANDNDESVSYENEDSLINHFSKYRFRVF